MRRIAMMLVLSTAITGAAVSLWARHQDPGKDPAAADRRAKESRINARQQAGNGIRVDELKVYDDSLLQQMLNAAEAKLAAMQVLDQGGISGKLGSVTGASLTTSGVGINAQGPSLPQTVTTANGATGSKQNTDTTNLGANGAPTTSTNVAVTNSGQPTQNVTTTAPQVAPPAVTAPAATASLPGSYSVSASDMLNEQMQLTYEIANLRLLLEGSLTDRLIKGTKLVKPRTTIGFPITITPDKRHANAVAVVEVEVEKIGDLGAGERPAITALLPREKTYNVASITDRSTSVGGGMVTGLVGMSGSWLWSHKTYYYVQDQDTLALSFQPEDKQKIGFQWQFRPVLGRSFVKSGQKQTFVQLAFPSDWSASSYGRVWVRTYWRKYDYKKSILKEVLADSLDDSAISSWEIPNYPGIEVSPKVFNNTSLEDLSGGQMLVRLYGKFLTGTYVRIGNTTLTAGSAGFTFEPFGIRFIASISDLATKQVVLVARDGTEIPLVIKRYAPAPPTDPKKPGPDQEPPPHAPPTITDLKIQTVDDLNSLVTIELDDPSYTTENPPLLMVVGQKVFGYSDLPVQRSGKTLTATVPTALLVTTPEIVVKPLFPPSHFEARYSLSQYSPNSQTDHLVVLEQAKDSVTFLLYGNRLKDVSLLSPPGAKLVAVGNPADADNLGLLTLTASQLASNKQILIQRSGDGERPMLVNIPTVAVTAAAPVAPVAPVAPAEKERITVGANQAILEGDGLSDVVRVSFKGKDVPFEKIESGKGLLLKNLNALGITSSSSVQSVELISKPGKTTVKLDVVSGKVETVAR